MCDVCKNKIVFLLASGVRALGRRASKQLGVSRVADSGGGKRPSAPASRHDTFGAPTVGGCASGGGVCALLAFSSVYSCDVKPVCPSPRRWREPSHPFLPALTQI